MPHPLSTLGAVHHTIISLVPPAAALYSFVRYRAIDPARRSGRIYLGGVALSVPHVRPAYRDRRLQCRPRLGNSCASG